MPNPASPVGEAFIVCKTKTSTRSLIPGTATPGTPLAKTMWMLWAY